MSGVAPAEVLVERLDHELYSALLLIKAADSFAALRRIEKAQEILAQLREAMR